jgi:hypothetical protein
MNYMGYIFRYIHGLSIRMRRLIYLLAETYKTGGCGCLPTGEFECKSPSFVEIKRGILSPVNEKLPHIITNPELAPVI